MDITGYKPINGCVLVELTESLEYVDIPDKQYSTRTSGIVVAESEDYGLVGKRVHFKDFEDGVQVEYDDKKYAFIKHEEIRGYVEA